MPKPRQPRHGSMQFWPRVRAGKSYARVRSFGAGEGLLAFAGYKMGMTHVKAFDTHKTSPTKNETINIPATIIECPPMRIFSVRGYNRDSTGRKLVREVVVAPKDKHLGRKVRPPKSNPPFDFSTDFNSISVLMMTQPSLTGIGQKKPQIFEVGVAGKTAAEQLEVVKSFIGKDIKASEILKEGDYVDFHAVTTGRGFQGPVKRFGIGLTSHKSEKSRRTPGSLGGWSGQQHFMYRVAMAGQHGYHQRVQYNNQILKITDNPDEINVKGGYLRYGDGKKNNEFVVVRGSTPGTSKRLITLVKAIRKKKVTSLPTVDEVSKDSNQRK